MQGIYPAARLPESPGNNITEKYSAGELLAKTQFKTGTGTRAMTEFAEEHRVPPESVPVSKPDPAESTAAAKVSEEVPEEE